MVKVSCQSAQKYLLMRDDIGTFFKSRFSTGPTLFEVQAKWVLRNPTQFGLRCFSFSAARNSSAAQLSSNQAFSFNISGLRKKNMLTFNT